MTEIFEKIRLSLFAKLATDETFVSSLIMTEIFENLSHVLRGSALMFFLVLTAHIYPMRKENKVKSLLFASMLMLGILELKDMVFLDTSLWNDGFINAVVILVDLYYVPTIALLFFEIVSPGWVTFRKYILFYLPLFLMEVAYVFTRSEILFNMIMLAVLIFGIVVTILILMAVSDYDNRIKQHFSEISEISVSWIRIAICGMLVSLVSFNLIFQKQSWVGDAGYYMISIVIWGYIYALAIKHRVISFAEIPDFTNEEESAEGSGNVSSSEDKSYDQTLIGYKLEKCMTEKECFLNPRLTLSELASDIGTNRTYLSSYINNVMKSSFYEYINSLRVEKAEKYLGSDPDIPLKQLCEDCGFNSFSTFSRAFVKYAGKTPARYAKDIKGRNQWP